MSANIKRDQRIGPHLHLKSNMSRHQTIIDCDEDDTSNEILDNHLNVTTIASKIKLNSPNTLRIPTINTPNMSPTKELTKSFDEGMKSTNTTPALSKTKQFLIGQSSSWEETLSEDDSYSQLIDDNILSASPINVRIKFRKSHTCGSLFAKCGCNSSPTLYTANDTNSEMKTARKISPMFNTTMSVTPPSPVVSNNSLTDSNIETNFTIDMKHANESNNRTQSVGTTIATGVEANVQLTNSSQRDYLSIDSCSATLSPPRTSSTPLLATAVERKPKRLFQSYSHPDTDFIFTDENKNPSKDSSSGSRQSNSPSFRTKSGKVEIKHPKRSSSPNIGNYTILDVAVHPDILLKVSPKAKHTTRSITDSRNIITARNSTSRSRPRLQRSSEVERGSTSDSENSIDILIEKTSSFESQSSTSSTAADPVPFSIDEISKPLSTPSVASSKQEKCLDAAQRYFQESGILGTIPSPHLIRKTSKILQDSNVIDQIRKTSKIYRTTGKSSFTLPKDTSIGYEEMEQSVSSTRTMQNNNLFLKSDLSTGNKLIDKDKIEADEDNNKVQNLEETINVLRDAIKSRDIEICKLKREIHKLKSVLQQTTNHMPLGNDELLTTLQTKRAMAGQKSPVATGYTRIEYPIINNGSGAYKYCELPDLPLKLSSALSSSSSSSSSSGSLGSSSSTSSTGAIGKNAHMLTPLHIPLNSAATEICSSSNYTVPLKNGKQITTASCAPDVGDDSINEFCSTTAMNKGSKINHLSAPVLKKQGVSGESCDTSAIQHSINVPIPKYDKDFRSKQLIKDAIMDNDFLKNIDSSQVRELVESMYSLDVAKGQYVIREGEAGAHLYVSAVGEFEVVKNDIVLGVMGPGKAFGELAILYNCTRTASIRVLSDASVWVLDRRVFQQIMMRTGLQRIENSVNFLRSVPLLKNLSNDVLSKIADVLEVEFYPAGTYIIRQGASGDTFFLISQGSVKVTQKFGTSTVEKEIRQLERGDYFGEQALINEDKRTANIIALAPGVECLTLDRESFTHLIGDLCELKEKNYGDESRVLAMKFAEQTMEIFGSNVKQEFPEMTLNDLEVVATLGIGGFGRVELVKAYRDNRVETYALKCLKKKHIIDTRQEEHVFSERTIMLTCRTPFICRLYRTFRDTKYVYMLLEACMGGEVWTILRDRGSFDENMTQFIIGCVLQAFEYLHSRGIIYRDLKPENLMLDERGYVKLVDFGFAKYIGNSSKTWTFCGTPEYVAPEIILNKGHDRAVDYWALGILIHELLNGTPPFTANDPMKTYNIILKGIDLIDFPKHMSRSAVMLIKKLCRDVPAERLGYQKGGIQDIKKHKWFLGFDWDGLANLTLIPPFLRPVSHSLDTSYFDKFPNDIDEPPDEVSGWDSDF